MNDATHQALIAAAGRYQRAVLAVFLKWDADSNGVRDSTRSGFVIEDLGCACCAEHRELRVAWDALSGFTGEGVFDP